MICDFGMVLIVYILFEFLCLARNIRLIMFCLRMFMILNLFRFFVF